MIIIMSRFHCTDTWKKLNCKWFILSKCIKRVTFKWLLIYVLYFTRCLCKIFISVFRLEKTQMNTTAPYYLLFIFTKAWYFNPKNIIYYLFVIFYLKDGSKILLKFTLLKFSYDSTYSTIITQYPITPIYYTYLQCFRKSLILTVSSSPEFYIFIHVLIY